MVVTPALMCFLVMINTCMAIITVVSNKQKHLSILESEPFPLFVGRICGDHFIIWTLGFIFLKDQTILKLLFEAEFKKFEIWNVRLKCSKQYYY